MYTRGYLRLFIQCIVVLLLGLGLSFIVIPKKIQLLALKYCRNVLPGVPNPFLEWMRTPEYLWMVRVIGGIAILMDAIVEYALMING